MTNKFTKKPWGLEFKWTPDGLPYVGKILYIAANHKISLQSHEVKTETWMLVSGRCKAILNNDEFEMEAYNGYTCIPLYIHRLIAITDCIIIEVSTPEVGRTYRYEDDYGREDK